MRKLMLAAVLFVCGACGGGGGSSTPTTVNGTVGGQSFGAQDAVSNTVSSGGTNSQGFLVITNAANTCAKLTASQQPKNAKAIAVGLATTTATTFSAPTGTGTFTVYSTAALVGAPPGNVAIGQYILTDAACNTTAEVETSSGTVTLTRVDGNGYAGTFDITFTDGSHVTGSFTAPKCSALSDNLSGTCV